MSRARHKRAGGPPDPQGMLLVDKPGGLTSHDIVARVRRVFRLAKVGHGGTLDPQATGLLVLLIGRATKLSQRVMGHDKTYEGALRLGITTDTQDADGRVLEERDARHLTRETVVAEMSRHVGDQMQTPPMVSAVKIDGVPLYKLARKGQEVKREARLIHIYEFSPLHIDLPRVTFRLRCTKGTYVRTICADMGEALGCGAILESLRRTQSGPFHVRDAYPLDDVLAWQRADLEEHLTPPQCLGPLGG